MLYPVHPRCTSVAGSLCFRDFRFTAVCCRCTAVLPLHVLLPHIDLTYQRAGAKASHVAVVAANGGHIAWVCPQSRD